MLGGRRFSCEPCRTALFGAIGANYTAIGTPMDHPIRLLYLYNLTDALLFFSFDGIDDHLRLPASGYFTTDITANKTEDSGLFLAKGNSLYVKQIDVPTTGLVSLTVFYGDSGY